MLGKRNKHNPSESRNKHSKWSEEIVDAMTDCVLPEEIMLCILTRLPVKSLLRFKSVCKPWRDLFASSDFVKMHRYHFSNDPKNEAFIVDVHRMSLYSIESDEKGPTYLDLPYPGMDILGCCNGLLCLRDRKQGQGIVLWNPATRLAKFVSPPKGRLLGFGYDSEKNDFKVVRIVEFEDTESRFGAQVYSSKLDSWKQIKLGFRLRVVLSSKADIVNGNPYWVVSLYDEDSQGPVFMWFDVKEMEFKIVPWPTLPKTVSAKRKWVDWKGSLASIACYVNKERVEFDVWVFDDGEMIWRLNRTFGPAEMKVERCLQCLKNGKIVWASQDGRLFVFDPENGYVKEFQIGEINNACLCSFKIYGYNESLAYIEGMKPV